MNVSFIGEEVTYLSYQTLTIDLYAPLLLLILLFSLIFTLLSCSCSRLSDRYRLATMYARPLYELSGQNTQDPTTILPSSYMVILYMLETLKGLSVYQATQETVQEKIDSLVFSSLWFSGLGSAVSLILAQYTAVKIQHEHDLTLGQRIIYFVSCIFITIAMMTSSLIFITVIILPVFTYIGRYHIMILVILFAAILGLGTLISLTLEFFGMNPTTITTDRVVPRFETNNLLTNFLRFSQVGSGQCASLLYAAARVAPGFSMVHGELHISFHLKSKLVITNPSPGVTAIKKPKVLEVARKDEKSGLTTSCLQTTRPMDSIIFTKAESTPNTTTMTFPLPPKPTVSTTPPYLGQNLCTSSDNEEMLTEKVDQGKVQHSSLLSHPRADNLTMKHPGHPHPHLCDCCVRPQPSHNVIHIG